MMARRSSSSITNLLSDISDNVKDFLDDEVLDRAADTERDVRKAGQNWTDDDDDDRGRRSGGRGGRDEDVDELYDAVRQLADKVDQMTKTGKGSGTTKTTTSGTK